MDKKSKPRLAVLVSHPIQYHAPLYREIARRGDVDLTVYYCSDQGATEKVDAGFGVSFKWDVPLLEGYKYVFLKNYSFRPNPDTFFGLVNPGIISELMKGRYDAVWVHGYSLMSNWFAFLGAWISRTPLLFRGETVLREGRPGWVRFIKYIVLKPLFGGTAAFLTIGSRSEEFYRHYGVPKEKMFFTPYAVDNEFFMGESERFRAQKERLKKKWGIPSHARVFLFVGKLIERKRPLDVLRAFKGIAQEDAALMFVGDGALRGELEQFAKEHRIKNVIFAGFKNQSELPEFYGIADVFVLPSLHEVSPLVINEAMCAGLPILVSDAVPSAVDFVKPGENGYVFQVGNVDALREYMDELLRHEKTRTRMGGISREFIGRWDHKTSAENIVHAVAFAVR